MIGDQTEPNEFRYRQKKDHSEIIGWGVDIDPKNDPTYPIKKRTGEESEGYSWERPPQQEINIEVLKSVERPNIPAVFGTSNPPTGLSGMIRRLAFKYSESSYGHWLPLVLADRVNMVEGLVDDLKSGYVPNIFKERGWTAEWKYNRKGFLIKTAATVAVTAGIATILLRNRENSKREEKRRRKHPINSDDISCPY